MHNWYQSAKTKNCTKELGKNYEVLILNDEYSEYE